MGPTERLFGAGRRRGDPRHFSAADVGPSVRSRHPAASVARRPGRRRPDPRCRPRPRKPIARHGGRDQGRGRERRQDRPDRQDARRVQRDRHRHLPRDSGAGRSDSRRRRLGRRRQPFRRGAAPGRPGNGLYRGFGWPSLDRCRRPHELRGSRSNAGRPGSFRIRDSGSSPSSACRCAAPPTGPSGRTEGRTGSPDCWRSRSPPPAGRCRCG